MGFISTGIKVGAGYAIARQGIKAYEHHNQNRNQQQQQQPQVQYAPQPHNRDITSYTHQSWCNGSCQGQCNAMGYTHLPYCNGQCGCQCNTEQSQTIRNVESYPQTLNQSPPVGEKEMPPKY